MMDTIDGIPTHPLFVHAPVVIIPLLALVALALLAQPKWRKKTSWMLAAALGAAMVATWLATWSGEALKELAVSDTEKHESLGKTTLLFTIGSFMAGSVTAALDRKPQSSDKLKLAATIASGTTFVLAALAAIWVYRTGHEGASLVWKSQT